jgi:acyl transferase domain-containing protein
LEIVNLREMGALAPPTPKLRETGEAVEVTQKAPLRSSVPAPASWILAEVPGTSETSLADRLPEDLRDTATDLDFGPLPFALSAKSKPALQESAERLIAHLRSNPELDPTDLAYSLATTRSSFDQRAVALASDTDELRSALDALAQGKSAPGLVQAQASQGRLAYLFTGQGSQRAGMAGALRTPPRKGTRQVCGAVTPSWGPPKG